MIRRELEAEFYEDAQEVLASKLSPSMPPPSMAGAAATAAALAAAANARQEEILEAEAEAEDEVYEDDVDRSDGSADVSIPVEAGFAAAQETAVGDADVSDASFSSSAATEDDGTIEIGDRPSLRDDAIAKLDTGTMPVGEYGVPDPSADVSLDPP